MYAPAQDSYVPPQQQYAPPQQNYGPPPTSNYPPPQGQPNYAPPQQSNFPPPQQAHNSGPPGPSFHGPQGGAPPAHGGAPQPGPGREMGTVVRVNPKGFGFIRQESGDEIFFHTREIQNAPDIRMLREHDRVEFQIGNDHKSGKREAQKVTVLTDVSHRSMGAPHGPPGGRGGYGGYGAPRGGYGGRGRGGFGGRGGYGQRFQPYGNTTYGAPPPVREEATIKSVNRERQYGFLMVNGNSVFFPRSQVVSPEFDQLKEGDVMTCVVGPDPRMPDKWMASDVRKAFEEGTVDGLKDHFGFINTDSGERVFFHGRYMKPGTTFEQLTEGARVEFKLVPSRKAAQGQRGSSMEAQDVTLINKEGEAPVDFDNQNQD